MGITRSQSETLAQVALQRSIHRSRVNPARGSGSRNSQRLVPAIAGSDHDCPAREQLLTHIAMYPLQAHDPEYSAAIADLPGISRGHAGMVLLPACFNPACDRPVAELLRRTASALNQTQIVRMFRTDETSHGESIRELDGIDHHHAVHARFSAGIEGDALEAITDARPIPPEKPMQPECRAGGGLRVNQRRTLRNISIVEVQVIE